MNREKTIRNFTRNYRAYLEGANLNVLFNSDGSWSGDNQDGGYSASDRYHNCDYLFAELNEQAKDKAISWLREACARLSYMKTNFGRDRLLHHEIKWHDVV